MKPKKARRSNPQQFKEAGVKETDARIKTKKRGINITTVSALLTATTHVAPRSHDIQAHGALLTPGQSELDHFHWKGHCVEMLAWLTFCFTLTYIPFCISTTFCFCPHKHLKVHQTLLPPSAGWGHWETCLCHLAISSPAISEDLDFIDVYKIQYKCKGVLN